MSERLQFVTEERNLTPPEAESPVSLSRLLSSLGTLPFLAPRSKLTFARGILSHTVRNVITADAGNCALASEEKQPRLKVKYPRRIVELTLKEEWF